MQIIPMKPAGSLWVEGTLENPLPVAGVPKVQGGLAKAKPLNLSGKRKERKSCKLTFFSRAANLRLRLAAFLWSGGKQKR